MKNQRKVSLILLPLIGAYFALNINLIKFELIKENNKSIKKRSKTKIVSQNADIETLIIKKVE